MEQFFTFLGNHPILVGTFLLLLFLFFRNERVRAGATVGTQELVRLVNKEKAIVLDVRERAEFIEGTYCGCGEYPPRIAGNPTGRTVTA